MKPPPTDTQKHEAATRQAAEDARLKQHFREKMLAVLEAAGYSVVGTPTVFLDRDHGKHEVIVTARGGLVDPVPDWAKTKAERDAK